MIFKIITLFLVAMMVLAVFGKMRFPGQKKLSALTCKKCSRYKIGKGPCACEKGKM
ncbi:hypothetical protein EDD53_1993 [Pacificibacter maritimus]|uniref:Uncharacterized protein n=1 Tax=Pacificibacter maritimus TaxID=762213 RepID=A0A3N4U677_9RHOB|nr:hypothetical protein EDD53_1993 [Pacificibacter maritimus]